MHFDFVDLRLMVRVAESNSLTKGAERSNISLPAASTRIKNLEENIGSKLLYRTSQGVTLTPPGQALVHHARLVLAQLENLSGDLQEYAKGIKGHLRVFANSNTAGEFLPAVLKTYLLTHPDVNVDLTEHVSHDIVRAISDGQADIGLIAGAVRTENLEVIPYRKDRLVLVVPEIHDLAESETVDFITTLDFPHIGLREGSAVHTFLRQICETKSRTFQMHIQVGNFGTVCRMIEAGVGVGIMPGAAAQRHSRSTAIRIIPLKDDWALHATSICIRNLEALPGYGREFIDLLLADAQTDNAGDTWKPVSPVMKRSP